ncbi:hypothetical protein V5799_031527 [Amblyomma americanum]|uniref:Monocarboxylate transporter n=1 Tax=Amblyomma americanum TaxID=6943 RepID=A0AAQ4EKL0_AMBAM
MDSPRSWVVAGACFWISMFSYPLLGAAGVVYVNILHTFHVTREEASWPVSLTSTFYLLAGIAVGGIRLNVVAVNKYFIKYLATASGLNLAGMSVGGFILPPLLQLLFDQFGFRGALLICGGITLNAVPAALLCGDPEVPRSSVLFSTKQKVSNTPNFENYHDHDHDQKEAVHDACDVNVNAYHKYQKIDGVHENRQREHVKYERFSELLSKNTSCALESPKGTTRDASPKDETAWKSTASNRFRVVCPVSKSNTEHAFSFALNPRFYLVTFTHLVIFTNMATYLTVIIDFAVDCGVAKWNAVLLVPVYSIADVAARLGSGWVTDRKFLSRCSWTALCLLCWSVALMSMPLGRSFYSLLVCAVVSGWCNGSTLSMVPVLFSEVTSAQHFAVCFGTGSSLVGLACLLRPLLIGKKRQFRLNLITEGRIKHEQNVH